MKNFVNILTEAPWWAYGIFIYLFSIGLRNLKPQTIWITTLFIMLLIITDLLIQNIFTDYKIQHHNLCIYLILLLIGSMISWLIFRNTKLSFDPTNNLIILSDGYRILSSLIFIFIIRYLWRCRQVTYTKHISTYVIQLKVPSSYILAEISLERSGTYAYKFFKAK